MTDDIFIFRYSKFCALSYLDETHRYPVLWNRNFLKSQVMNDNISKRMLINLDIMDYASSSCKVFQSHFSFSPYSSYPSSARQTKYDLYKSALYNMTR